MRTQISKPEYALITVAVAQKLTGSKTATPTAKQLAEAQKQTQAAVLRAGVGVKGGTAKIDKLFNKARNELSGISGMGDEECAGIWDTIKSGVSKIAPAIPFIGPAAGLVAPTAAIVMAQNAKKAQKAQKAAPPPPPPQASASPQASADSDDVVNTQVVGYDDLIYGESMTAAYDRALARLSGDDELIYGEGGGSSELGAARRRKTPYYFPPFASGADVAAISPTAYRVAVLQRAKKLARGGRPSTKAMYIAQKTVDKDLTSGGISVRIPGAAPGRVTR
jgi:hypothetical protein